MEIEAGQDYLKDDHLDGFIQVTRVDDHFVWGRQFILDRRTSRPVCIDIEIEKFWIKKFHSWKKRVIQ